MGPSEKLKAFLSSSARNKLVFCVSDYIGLSFVDVGKELSHMLMDSEDKDLLSLFSHSSYDESIGKYLALENIAILFEPELKLKLRSILESFSINKCLIIKSEGRIEGETYYLMKGETSCNINLCGLSYIEI